ncbi:MAG: hypothetical protein SFZ23_02225 [Planctomycetota bacterium]|nr:hypothetical protein [Planctomycetota bacterium]
MLGQLVFPRRWLVLGLGLLSLLFCSACGGSPDASDLDSPDTDGPSEIQTAPGGSITNQREDDAERLEPVVEVIAGSPVVVPLSSLGRAGELLAREPGLPLRFDDGRPASARVVTLRTSFAQQLRASWLPPMNPWTVIEGVAESSAEGVSVPVLWLHPPAETIGLGLWVKDLRVALRWIVPVRAQEATRDPAAWEPVLDEEDRGSSTLIQLLAPEAATPLGRWRFRLLTEGLRPPPADERDAALRFEDPVVEALAHQEEDRWRVALLRLHQANPSLAKRIKRRLAAVVTLDGVPAPAWPAEWSDLGGLRRDLLDPERTDAQIVRRAETWLRSQPAGAAWVVDDAAGIEAGTGAVLAAAGMVNISDASVLGTLAPEGRAATPELAPLEPFSSSLGLFAAAEPAKRESLQARVGGWRSASLPVAPMLRASPPALVLGPFVDEWTMREWIAGISPPPPPLAAARASLFFRPESLGRGKWILFVECPRAEPASGGSSGEEWANGERVQVWLGPRAAPRAVIRVHGDGRWTMLVEPTSIRAQATLVERPGVRVASSPAAWWCEIELPEQAPEAATPRSPTSGVLLVGVERLESAGRRTSWPRPCLPWQVEPGRVAVDLRAWASPVLRDDSR